MPRVNWDKLAVEAAIAKEQANRTRETWIDRIQRGRFIPILSNSACHDIAMMNLSFPAYQALLDEYAAHTGFSSADRSNRVTLAAITQYLNMSSRRESQYRIQPSEEYINFVKEFLFWIARQANENSKNQMLAQQANEDPEKLLVHKRPGLLQKLIAVAKGGTIASEIKGGTIAPEVNAKKVSLRPLCSDEKLEIVAAKLDSLSLWDLAIELGFAKFANQGIKNLLLVLANLPLSIYLTTSYHYYIEMALCRVGKTPRTIIYPWRQELDSVRHPFYYDLYGKLVFDAGYEPTEEQPLVYHLAGVDSIPGSLALSEEDQSKLLNIISSERGPTISSSRGSTIESMTHTMRIAVDTCSPLLIGYSLNEWDYKLVFQGLLEDRVSDRIPLDGLMQVLPTSTVEAYTNQQNLEAYLRSFNIKVFWGDFNELLSAFWNF